MQSIQKTTLTLVLLLFCTLCIQETAFSQLRDRNNTNIKAPTRGVQVKTQAQITKEVEHHFKSMKYNYEILSDDQSKTKAVQSFQGKGTAKGKKGKSIQYKWYVTTDSKGYIVHMYAGDNSQFNFEGSMGIKRGEHGRRKSACLGKKGEEQKRCLRNLWADTVTDCLLAFDNKSQCRKDCWYRGGYCIK